MKYRIATALIKIARGLCPMAWEDATKQATSDVSVTVTMSCLDHLGYSHCSACAQTQGLFNIAGRAYCHRHRPKLDATVWAIN